jgi:hypothetical protein
MILFKSRLRKRIETKRIELTKRVLKIEDEKAKMKQNLNPSDYSHLIILQCELKDDIKLLTEILQ